MSLRRSSGTAPSAGAAERRGLGLLLEGAAVNLPQIDLGIYRRFRSAILRNSIAISEPQPESELLQTLALIVREFETYRVESEAVLQAREKGWQHLTGMLMHLLAVQEKVSLESDLWTGICSELAAAVSEEEIAILHTKLQKLFHRKAGDAVRGTDDEEEERDRSTENDNASGLRGGGAAIEHLRVMLSKSRPGYICLFRLSCLDVVGERFGPEGMQDCLMTVSAFLIKNLRREDIVYHWSDSSLLAVCDRKIREEILTAELNRVLACNRDFTLQVSDRTIMLRIPIELSIYPISHFESADDLQNLPVGRVRGDRTLSDRAQLR